MKKASVLIIGFLFILGASSTAIANPSISFNIASDLFGIGFSNNGHGSTLYVHGSSPYGGYGYGYNQPYANDYYYPPYHKPHKRHYYKWNNQRHGHNKHHAYNRHNHKSRHGGKHWKNHRNHRNHDRNRHSGHSGRHHNRHNNHRR